MEVKVTILGIEDLSAKTKLLVTERGRKLVTKLTFQADIPPVQLARVLNLQKQGVPLDATIQSPQATMDLDLMPTTDATQPAIPGKEST